MNLKAVKPLDPACGFQFYVAGRGILFWPLILYFPFFKS